MDGSFLLDNEDLMWDLMALAIKNDSTRVISMTIPITDRTLFVDGKFMSEGYHRLSHHGNKEEKIEGLLAIERRHMAGAARFLKALKDTAEADGGSMLDSTVTLIGSAMGDAAAHRRRNYPLLVAGGGFKHKRHLSCDQGSGAEHDGLRLVRDRAPAARPRSRQVQHQRVRSERPPDMKPLRLAALAASLAVLGLPAGANPSDSFRDEFTAGYCTACHGGENPAGGFLADPSALDPSNSSSREQWQRAIEYVADGVMPPTNAPQPTSDARERFAKDLLGSLALPGEPLSAAGGLVRRLNRIEYLNTLRDLFRIREIRLPVTFPDDTPDQRFDTMAEGTYLTPGHLDAYQEVAIDIADRLVPLPGLPVVRSASVRASVGVDPARVKYWTRDGDETGLYFTGINIAGWSGALWDKAFTAPASGVYRIRLKVSAEADAGADGKPLRLGLLRPQSE